jgi:phosphatidylglycerol:prolipoprotein diacylglycerol transferase
MAKDYYIFNIDPCIFRLKNLGLENLFSPWGLSGLFLLLIILFSYRYLSQKFQKGLKIPSFISPRLLLKTTSQLKNFDSLLFYLIFILCALFGYDHLNPITKKSIDDNWGGPRWYGLMYVLSIIIIYYGFQKASKAKKILLTESELLTGLFYAVVGMIVGARLFYVFIYDWPTYKDHPIEIFWTFKGGLSFHGGFVGVLLGVGVFCYRYKIPFLPLMDRGALLLPLCLALGRLGNFINGELWGRTTTVPWAMIFPHAGYEPRHPSQIYQSLSEGLLLFLTLFIISRFKQREGTLISCFVIFYAIYRFFMEYFREADSQLSYFSLKELEWIPFHYIKPNAPFWQYMTMGQILCLIFCVLGLIGLVFTRKNLKEGSKPWQERRDAFFKTHS